MRSLFGGVGQKKCVKFGTGHVPRIVVMSESKEVGIALLLILIELDCSTGLVNK